MDILQQILGRAVPAALLIKHLEIPASVMLPTKITPYQLKYYAVSAYLAYYGHCQNAYDDSTDDTVRIGAVVTIMIGLIASVWFLCNKSDSFSMRIKPGYMSFGRKSKPPAAESPARFVYCYYFRVSESVSVLLAAVA